MTRLILLALLLAACDSGSVPPYPGSHAVQLVWADGETDYPGWCEGHVPTWFRCVDGGDCKPSILAGVRAWLAPFDATVTDRYVPDPLVTVLVSSGLAQECGRAEGLRGLAMIGAPAAGSWVNIWSAGNDDRADAQTIAHELGHAIGGLKHTHAGSVMQADEQPVAVGYDDVWRDNLDGTRQDAFEAMLETLGGAR